MSVVAVGSVRSCGVTALALGLAATWPDPQHVLLAELDPVGGTLAGAAGWEAEPSLVSLAAAARRGAAPSVLYEHCRALPGGAAVLVAPASASQARAALGVLGPLLGRLGELERDVVVDVGRLDPESPALGVLKVADMVLLCVRPRLADLNATATWLQGSPAEGGRCSLVVVGDGPYPDHEIADALCVPVVARVPWDPGSAEALPVVSASSRRLRAAPLVRSARTLAATLATERAGEIAGSEGAEVGHARSALAHRVLAPWRPRTATSANGHAPEGAST